jgi:hypothetical protein
VNWSAYQTRVNEDESAEGRFTLAEPHSGDGDHMPQAANFKAEHLLLFGMNASMFATTPCRGLSLSRSTYTL